LCWLRLATAGEWLPWTWRWGEIYTETNTENDAAHYDPSMRQRQERTPGTIFAATLAQSAGVILNRFD